MLVSDYSIYKNTDESGDQDETENLGYVDDLTEDNFLDDSETVWEEENKETCAPPEKQKMFNFS
jgi:hypothetical protein